MKKRHCPEQIVAKLRQADVELGKGSKVAAVCRQLGVSEQTYYRWRTKYGGMDPLMAKQMKEPEKENARLKRLVADQALDMAILKEAARPNGSIPSVVVGPWKRCVGVWGVIRSVSVGRAQRWPSRGSRRGTV